jgi:WD40 repeat protein
MTDGLFSSDRDWAQKGSTLCELNGTLLAVQSAGDTNALRLYRSSGGPELPQLDAGIFGFSVQESHEADLRVQPRRGAPPLSRRDDRPLASLSGGLAGLMSLLRKTAAAVVPGMAQSQPNEPPPTGRVRAISWQSPLPALSAGSTAAAGSSAAPRQCHLCAVALDESCVLLYDVCSREWSAHRLVNTHQRDVRALAWQPLSASVLAVGCAGGVCVWRLAYGRNTGELTGAHLTRCIDFPPVRSLAWHPLGDWLAAASAEHAAVRLCEPWCRSEVAEQHAGAGSWLGSHRHRSVSASADQSPSAASMLWMRGGGGGISLVAASMCGTLLLGAGTAGTLRVWATRNWSWQTWRRFNAPCSAAAWGGPTPFDGDAPRLLLFTLAHQPLLHALRFTHLLGADCNPRTSGEYIGCFDLGLLAASGGLNSAAPSAKVAAGAPAARRRFWVTCLAWSVDAALATGRLAVGCTVEGGEGAVILFEAGVTPAVRLRYIGNVSRRPPPGQPGPPVTHASTVLPRVSACAGKASGP